MQKIIAKLQIITVDAMIVNVMIANKLPKKTEP